MPNSRFRRQVFALATLVAWFACAAGAPPAAAARAAVPDPEPGMWAATTLSLLHFQRSLCDGIAGQVIEHWQTLEGSPEDQERAIRDYVLENQLSDLAASRSAADIIQGLLPRAGDEVSAETHSSLQRLYSLEKALCDTVALPTAPVDAFQESVRAGLERIEREAAELGRLFVVPDDVLEAALEPFLMPIQLAGIEAEGEYLEYLESIRPKPQGPTFQQRMVTWHRTVYSPAVAPSKAALADYLRARQSMNNRAMAQACRRLAGETIQLLRRKDVLKAPDEKIEGPLTRAYTELRGLATECTAGRSREVQVHWSATQQFLGQAAERLARYGLKP